VDEVQVDVVEPELLEREVHGVDDGLRPLVAVPQLGRDEQLVARDAGFLDRAADALLVAVGGSGVDVPVSDLERVADDALSSVRIDEEDAEAELRDAVAVIELDRGNRHLSSLGGPDAAMLAP
jgi:hypothetical protein